MATRSHSGPSCRATSAAPEAASARTHSLAATSTFAQPAAAAASSSDAPSPLAAAWRCPNEVVRRLFPASALHSLLHFLTAPPRSYPLDRLLQPDDPADYRALLTDTIVAEMQPLVALHAAAAAAQTKQSQGSGRGMPTVPFDQVPLATWMTVPACPIYVAAIAPSTVARSASSGPNMFRVPSAASAAAAPPPPPSDGMRSLLLHVVARLMSRGPQSISLLTQGYAHLDNNRNRSGIGDLYIHAVETNTLVTFLQTRSWTRLLARIGDALMQWLLSYTAIFHALDNQCVVQLCGPSLAKVHRSITAATAAASSSASIGHPRKLLSSGTTLEPALARQHLSRSMSAAALTPGAMGPSRSDSRIPPTLLPMDVDMAAAPPTAAVSATVLAPRPRRRPRPAALPPLLLTPPLPRSGMFYRAPLKSEVGLPPCHILQRCPASNRGARRLLAYIYNLDTGGARTTATTASAAVDKHPAAGALQRSVSAAAPARSTGVAATAAAPHSLLTRSLSTPQRAPTHPPPPAAAHTSLRAAAALPAPVAFPPPVDEDIYASMPPLIASSLAFLDAGGTGDAAGNHNSNGTRQKKTKKRIRIKSDARKEKRRVQLESRYANGQPYHIAEPVGAAAAVASASLPNPTIPSGRAAASVRAALPAASSPPPCTDTTALSAAPLPLAPLHPRLKPLLPLLARLLKRHHACYYKRWLHECCPWSLPAGVRPPTTIAPSSAAAAATATAATKPIGAAVVRSAAREVPAGAEEDAHMHAELASTKPAPGTGAVAAAALVPPPSPLPPPPPSIFDDGGPQSMSLDDSLTPPQQYAPSVTPAPATPSAACAGAAAAGTPRKDVTAAPSQAAPHSASTPSASFASMSSRISAVSPVVSQSRNSVTGAASAGAGAGASHSPQFLTPLSQAPSSAASSGRRRGRTQISPSSSAAKDHELQFLTQATDSSSSDDDDDGDEQKTAHRRFERPASSRPIPMQSLTHPEEDRPPGATVCASLSVSGGASPQSLSQEFHPPSLAQALASALIASSSQHSSGSNQHEAPLASTPSSDATAEALLRRLHSPPPPAAQRQTSVASPAMAAAAAAASAAAAAAVVVSQVSVEERMSSSAFTRTSQKKPHRRHRRRRAAEDRSCVSVACGASAPSGSGTTAVAAGGARMDAASNAAASQTVASSSPLSSSQQQQHLSSSQRRRLRKKDLRRLLVSSKQTQTLSRRSHAYAMGAAAAAAQRPNESSSSSSREPFLPLSQLPLSVLLQMSTPSAAVVDFIVRVGMDVLPPALFGGYSPSSSPASSPSSSSSGAAPLRRWIHRVANMFVRLRRFETCSTQHALAGLALRHIAWLNLPPRRRKRSKHTKSGVAAEVVDDDARGEEIPSAEMAIALTQPSETREEEGGADNKVTAAALPTSSRHTPARKLLNSAVPTSPDVTATSAVIVAPTAPTVALTAAALAHAPKPNPRPVVKRRGKNRRGRRPLHKLTVPKQPQPSPAATAAADVESMADAPGSLIIVPRGGGTDAAIATGSPSEKMLRQKSPQNHLRAAAVSSKKKKKKQKCAQEDKRNSHTAPPAAPACHRHRSRVPSSVHPAQLRVLGPLVRWVLSDFVLALLRANFYCTDTEGSRHRVVYYRREVWAEVGRRALEDLTGPSASSSSAASSSSSGGLFVQMERRAAMEYLARRLQGVASTTQLPLAPVQGGGGGGSGGGGAEGATAVEGGDGATAVAAAGAPTVSGGGGGSDAPIAAVPSPSTVGGFGLGVARLRLRPRKNGTVRPIVNMARGGQIRVGHPPPLHHQPQGSDATAFSADAFATPTVLSYPPVNTVLRHVFEVLRYEKDNSTAPSTSASTTTAANTGASSSSSSSAAASATVPSRSPSTVTAATSSFSMGAKRLPSRSGGAQQQQQHQHQQNPQGGKVHPRSRPKNITGCSVFGIHAIHARLRAFGQQWRELQPIQAPGEAQAVQPSASPPSRRRAGKKPSTPPRSLAPLYGVCVDIRSCFDRIHRPTLLSLLSSRVFLEPSYSLGRFAMLTPFAGWGGGSGGGGGGGGRGRGGQHVDSSSGGGIKTKFMRGVAPSNGVPMFVEECARRTKGPTRGGGGVGGGGGVSVGGPLPPRHALFIDSVSRRFVSTPSLLSLLREHLYQNFVMLPGVGGTRSLLHQVDGIPQGSVLSSLLCCVYLGHIEKSIIVPEILKASKKMHSSSSSSSKPSGGGGRVPALSKDAAQRTRSVTLVAPSTTPAVSLLTLTKSASEITSTNMLRKRARENPPTPVIGANAAAPPPALDDDDAHADKRPRLSSSAATATAAAPSPAPAPCYPPLHLLLRQMDDFMFLTTSLPAARRFLEVMSRGFREPYGMEINDSKTRVWLGEEYHREQQERQQEAQQRQQQQPGGSAIDPASASQASSSSSSSSCSAVPPPPPTTTKSPQPLSSRTLHWNGYIIDVPTLTITADFQRLKADRPTTTKKKKQGQGQAQTPGVPQGTPRPTNAQAASAGAVAASSAAPRARVPLLPDRCSLADSLTLDYTRTPWGACLSRSFRRSLHPRVHPLLLSSSSSPSNNPGALDDCTGVACRNLFENFAVAMAKMCTQVKEARRVQHHVHSSRVPTNSNSKTQGGGGGGSGRGDNQLFMLRVLLDGIEYALNLAHARFKALRPNHTPTPATSASSGAATSASDVRGGGGGGGGGGVRSGSSISSPRFPLSNLQVRFLALHAFALVLQRKQSRWALILAMIRRLLRGEAMLLRFEKVQHVQDASAPPTNRPSHPPSQVCPGGGSDADAASSLSSAEWSTCLHVGLYKLRAELQQHHKPGAAPLGCVPVPHSMMRAVCVAAPAPPPSSSTSGVAAARLLGKRRRDTSSIHAVRDEGVPAAVIIMPQAKRARGDDSTRQVPDSRLVPVPVMNQSSPATVPEAPSSRPREVQCICGQVHTAAPSLTERDLHQLRIVRAMLPELRPTTDQILRDIKF